MKPILTPNQLQELLKNNPNVDAEQLREAINLINSLGAEGVSDSQYDLVSPFDRRFGVERKASRAASLNPSPRTG
jgi:hypothetical protein